MCMYIMIYPLVTANNVYQVRNIVILIWLNVISLGINSWFTPFGGI